MSDTAKAIVGLGAVIFIASLSGYMLITGLSRGVVYSHRVAYSRANDPSNFRFYTTCYAVMFFSTGGLLAYFAIDGVLKA